VTTGPGSPDAHHRTATDHEADGILERVVDEAAEEVVEELDLHRTPPEDEPLPSMSEQISEQLGGVRGLVESSIPVLAFVVLNYLLGTSLIGLSDRDALYWAIGAAVSTAVAIGGYRLYRREPVRHAVNGVFGIALGAWLAWRSGEARDFYLPGILQNFGLAALLIVSVVFRRPLVGYVWAVLSNKGKNDWLDKPRLFRTFQWLSVAWAVSFILRAGLQSVFYLADQEDLLGLTKLVFNYPVYAATIILTIWATRRVTRTQAVEPAAA
jgi:hypothetical protein